MIFSRLRLESDPDGWLWVLLDDFFYQADDGTLYVVPRGFVTDLGTVPRIFWAIIPPHARFRESYVLHDWLWRVDKKLANRVLGETLKKQGAALWERAAILGAVTLYAGQSTQDKDPVLAD